MGRIHSTNLMQASQEINAAVMDALSGSPGRMEYRYLEHIRNAGAPTSLIDSVSYVRESRLPLLLTGLPQYADIEATKILALLVGSAAGVVVAYADYNGSYLTDIFASENPLQASASPALLRMHNDFPYAPDNARPMYIVLVPHLAQQSVPKTLLAPATEVIGKLPAEARTLLRQKHFEAHSGKRLVGVAETHKPITILAEDDRAVPSLRFHFDGTIGVAKGVDTSIAARCNWALDVLFATALEVGFDNGHAARKGECLLIPNDHCSHGRDALDMQACRRLVFRAYAVEPAVTARAGSTILRLAHA